MIKERFPKEYAQAELRNPTLKQHRLGTCRFPPLMVNSLKSGYSCGQGHYSVPWLHIAGMVEAMCDSLGPGYVHGPSPNGPRSHHAPSVATRLQDPSLRSSQHIFKNMCRAEPLVWFEDARNSESRLESEGRDHDRCAPFRWELMRPHESTHEQLQGEDDGCQGYSTDCMFSTISYQG